MAEIVRYGFMDWRVLYVFGADRNGEIRIAYFRTRRQAEEFVKGFYSDLLEFTRH